MKCEEEYEKKDSSTLHGSGKVSAFVLTRMIMECTVPRMDVIAVEVMLVGIRCAFI